MEFPLSNSSTNGLASQGTARDQEVSDVFQEQKQYAKEPRRKKARKKASRYKKSLLQPFPIDQLDKATDQKLEPNSGQPKKQTGFGVLQERGMHIKEPSRNKARKKVSRSGKKLLPPFPFNQQDKVADLNHEFGESKVFLLFSCIPRYPL